MSWRFRRTRFPRRRCCTRSWEERCSTPGAACRPRRSPEEMGGGRGWRGGIGWMGKLLPFLPFLPVLPVLPILPVRAFQDPAIRDNRLLKSGIEVISVTATVRDKGGAL